MNVGFELGWSLGEAMGIAIGGAPTLRSAAGPNLILEFDCRDSSAEGSWLDLQNGVALVSPGSATAYEPDTGYFNDLPVHQSFAGSARSLSNLEMPDLLPIGSRPELIIIARMRLATNGWFVRMTDTTVSNAIMGYLTASGFRTGEFASGTFQNGAGDTDVHMYSVLYDTDGTPRVLVDGAQILAGSAGDATDVTLGLMSVGGNVNNANCVDASFAWIGVVSQQLTSAQRGVVLAAAQSIFGF